MFRSLIWYWFWLIFVLPQVSTYDLPKKEKRPRRWRSKNNGKETKATLQVHVQYLFCSAHDHCILVHKHSTVGVKGKVAYICSPFSVFVHQVPSCISSKSPRLHASNPNLSTTESNAQEVCTDSPDSPTDVSRLQEDFCRLACNSEFLPKCVLHTEKYICVCVCFYMVRQFPWQLCNCCLPLFFILSLAFASLQYTLLWNQPLVPW